MKDKRRAMAGATMGRVLEPTEGDSGDGLRLGLAAWEVKGNIRVGDGNCNGGLGGGS